METVVFFDLALYLKKPVLVSVPNFMLVSKSAQFT